MTNGKDSIVIIIDCWPSVPELLVNNIKNTCVSYDHVKTIIFSNYNNRDKISKNDPGFELANSLFCTETKFNELRNQWNNSICDTPTCTHKDLLGNWHRKDQTVISASSALQLLYYCNHIQTNIDQIYFFGHAWDICVKIRPTGWMQLSALQYHKLFYTPKKFLSKPECVVDVNFRPIYEFNHPWQKLPNGDWYLSDYQWK